MIADDTLFKHMLSMERRRCERSGGRFALLLLDMEAVKSEITAPPSAIESAVDEVMRETDITGWYRQESTLGVILTSVNGVSRGVLEPIVVERIRNALGAHISESVLQQIWVTCHMFPEDSGEGGGGELERLLIESTEPSASRRRSAILKRTFDILGSLTALTLSSPFLLLITACVKATSPGPAFFRQKRIGQDGREFTFLKFRSMAVNNDSAIHKEYVRNLIAKNVDAKNGNFKIKDDPRVTPIGGFLRRTSLDELPQFINVLKGDMSLVGPRPPIPYELENYALWHRRRILEVKPGITGAWQVEGRSRTSFDEMVRMDLRYIRNQTLWLDLKILLKTPKAVIGGSGAY